MSAKELKDKLKKLRAEHSGKAVGKMSPEELEREIQHHEVACRQRELKEKRLASLAKARESKVIVKVEKVEEKPKKEKKAKEEKKEEKPKKEKKVVVKSDSEESDTDSSSDTETIKSRIQKKKFANAE
jgi:colicin import membrane protein